MRRFTTILLLVAASLAAWPCRAAMVSVNFQGTVSSIVVNSSTVNSVGSIGLGDSFSGFFAYDTAATYLSGPDPSIYRVDSGQVYVSATIDGLLFEGRSSNIGLLQVFNDTAKSTPPGDVIAMAQDVDVPPDWTIASSGGAARLTVALLDSSQSVFTDESAPLSLNLSDFDLRMISVALRRVTPPGGTELAEVNIYGDIQTQAVPEPSGLAGLLGAGLIGLAFVARARTKRREPMAV